MKECRGYRGVCISSVNEGKGANEGEEESNVVG